MTPRKITHFLMVAKKLSILNVSVALSASPACSAQALKRRRPTWPYHTGLVRLRLTASVDGRVKVTPTDLTDLRSAGID